MSDMMGSFKFEQLQIHSTLYAIATKDKRNVVGYVSKNPDSGAWFWFMGCDISIEFLSKDVATEDLVRAFTTFQLDNRAKKLGIIDNKNYVKQ